MAQGGPPLNFASITGNKAQDQPLRSVQLDGHVVLKIVKHCRESYPTLVTGQLLGLDIGQTLEVTDCYAFPRTDEQDDGAMDASSYQVDMMRCLREVNIDNNTVGWYQSTKMGVYQAEELITTYLSYQESIKRCICIVYDPVGMGSGRLPLRAVTLKEAFAEAAKKEGVLSLTFEKLRAKGVSRKDIFEEIPITLHNSPLAAAMATALEPEMTAAQSDTERLSLSVAPKLESNLSLLNACLDDVFLEQQTVSQYARALAWQQQQQAQWLQRRRQENAGRRANGEEPLPEEDPNQFKPIKEPPAIDGFLVFNQLNQVCNQLNGITAQGLQKVALLQGFQRL
ncbi:hypothetical protein WJX84_005064 [Apatococcus fuscideae]|uniref:Eukaryotic translation initiation factor 3 subunit H n=1 Tax=Apatococcus fuscideae TaxID=2026836 RepID=A0AAW1TBX5_9CHLO